MVGTVFGNKALIAAIVAWLTAQVIKFGAGWVSTGKPNFRRLVQSGGMPSSHSSSTVALTAIVFRTCGYASPEFAMSCIFSLIVMYDAAGVRHAAGQQARVLNYFLENWEVITKSPKMMEMKLKEFLGHTPIEVFVGAILGILVSLFF
jgi:acid phosphatase family membrane protein YuiD